ncbi:MAG: hypothetical protein RL291_1932 [Pseudomonadota bacterium]
MTKLRVANDGVLTGTTEQSFTGAMAKVARQWVIDRSPLRAPPDNAPLLQDIANGWRTPASGAFRFDSPSALSDPYKVTSSYKFDAKWQPPPRGGNLAFPVGLPIFGRPGHALLGQRQATRSAPFFCMAGTQSETIELTFGDDLAMPRLPPPRQISTADFEYLATFETKGRTIVAQRTFVSRVPGQVCAPTFDQTHAEPLRAMANSLSAYLPFGARNLSPGEPGMPAKRAR